jgi:hypothetical protein
MPAIQPFLLNGPDVNVLWCGGWLIFAGHLPDGNTTPKV